MSFWDEFIKQREQENTGKDDLIERFRDFRDRDPEEKRIMDRHVDAFADALIIGAFGLYLISRMQSGQNVVPEQVTELTGKVIEAIPEAIKGVGEIVPL